MAPHDYDRFRNLTFEDFRRLAKHNTLSRHEKVGFPNVYREGKEESIFRDITRKLSNLAKRHQLVVDVGPGCGGLASLLTDLCRGQGHRLVLIDSQEMLDHLPDDPFITKVAAYYPRECKELLDEYSGKVHALLSYSVLPCVFAEGNLFDFLDCSLSLLADGGELLLGDVPNMSKRKRFFSSPNGVKFHQHFTGTDSIPEVTFNTPSSGEIDDAVVFSLLMRCRAAGFDAYCLPQADDLPMANRREDILIRKP